MSRRSGFSWADEVEKEEEEEEEEARHGHRSRQRTKTNPFGSARPREVVLEERRIRDRELHHRSASKKENGHEEDFSTWQEQSFSPSIRSFGRRQVPSFSERFDIKGASVFVPPILYPPKNIASVMERINRSKNVYSSEVDFSRPRNSHIKRDREITSLEERYADAHADPFKRERDNTYNENGEKSSRRPISGHDHEQQYSHNFRRFDDRHTFHDNKHFDVHEPYSKQDREDMFRETGARNKTGNELINRPTRVPSHLARGSSNNKDREWDNSSSRDERRFFSERFVSLPMMNESSRGFILRDNELIQAVNEVDYESMDNKYGRQGSLRNGFEGEIDNRGKREMPPHRPNREYDQGQRRFDENRFSSLIFGVTGDRDRAQLDDMDMRRTVGFDQNKRKREMRPESSNYDFHQRKRK